MIRRLSILALALVPMVFLMGCEEETVERQIIRPVRAVKVSDAVQLTGRTFPGRAKAHNEVNLSFRVAGPLITRPVNVGDVVTEGLVLARIDPRDFEVKLRNVQAQLQQAKANLKAMRQARPEDIRRLTAQLNKAKAASKLAASEHKRVMSIRAEDPGAVSADMVDRAVEQKDRAEADLRNAREELRIGQRGARTEDIAAKEAEIRALQASVDSAKDELSYTFLKAPFDGTIVSTYVENFEFVQAKQQVARLLDTRRIEFVVNIPENLISNVPYVRDIEVRFDAFPDRQIPAKVSKIGTEASQTTRTYPVTLLMDQPENIKILPGMAGQASGRGQPPDDAGKKKMEVPVSAVFSPDETGKSFVWVIDENTKAVSRREVKTGPLTDLGILVQDGLKPGEWIATAGVHYLREGQQVRLLTN
jgi:RND family efflux transporter MFP subunit